MKRRQTSNADRFAWGLVFIVLGVVFLLDQMGYVDFGTWRHWWPFIVIALGLGHLIRPRRAKDFGHAAMWTLMGLWFLAADRGWHGLNWNNSWPLAMVAIGASIVVEVISARSVPDRPEEDGDVTQNP